MLPQVDGGLFEALCSSIPRCGAAGRAGLQHDGQLAYPFQLTCHHGLQDGEPVSFNRVIFVTESF